MMAGNSVLAGALIAGVLLLGCAASAFAASVDLPIESGGNFSVPKLTGK